ncbi:hypothetical protein ABZW18_16065 [Streptomyces sp. NPDC004647]|uniref:hypothetical protein n=1 Tax=Streptomyces sp. NPDC004647 TaxID=3154671 RepID=UPI0033BF1CD8
MSTNSAHQTCNHPARDVTIVALGSAVVALVAVIAVMALDGGPLAALAGSGSAFAAAFSVGMGVLAHMKRTA